jgi:hypothetical protein
MNLVECENGHLISLEDAGDDCPICVRFAYLESIVKKLEDRVWKLENRTFGFAGATVVHT